MSERATDAPRVPVWDLPVRVLHAALVVTLAASAASTLVPSDAHRWIGYAALAVVALRLLWSPFGSPPARFSTFVRTPRATWRYLRAAAARREPRHLGHNPLGGWMVLALLGCVVALGVTGWLYTTDRYWGSEAVERVHRALAWALLGLVVAHVAGVLHTGRRHRENLVRAMLDGRKRAPQGDDVG